MANPQGVGEPGYATEAPGALLGDGLGPLGFTQIGSHTTRGNTGSCPAPEKLGMEPLGVVKELCEMDGARLDANGYMLTRDRWVRPVP